MFFIPGHLSCGTRLWCIQSIYSISYTCRCSRQYPWHHPAEKSIWCLGIKCFPFHQLLFSLTLIWFLSTLHLYRILGNLESYSLELILSLISPVSHGWAISSVEMLYLKGFLFGKSGVILFTLFLQSFRASYTFIVSFAYPLWFVQIKVPPIQLNVMVNPPNYIFPFQFLECMDLEIKTKIWPCGETKYFVFAIISFKLHIWRNK